MSYAVPECAPPAACAGAQEASGRTRRRNARGWRKQRSEPALREELRWPASPPAHWAGVSRPRQNGGGRVSLGLGWPGDRDGLFEAPSVRVGPPCAPLPAGGGGRSGPLADTAWSARSGLMPGGGGSGPGGGKLFAAATLGGGFRSARGPPAHGHSARSAAAEAGVGGGGREGARPLYSRFRDRLGDGGEENDDDGDDRVAVACPWPADVGAGCVPAGEDHAQKRRRSECGRGGPGMDPGRSKSGRVGRRCRLRAGVGDEGQPGPFALAEAGEWLAGPPLQGARPWVVGGWSSRAAAPSGPAADRRGPPGIMSARDRSRMG